MTFIAPWAQGNRGSFWRAGAPDVGVGLPGHMHDPDYTGQLLKMEIRIRDSQGNFVAASKIEIWHADQNGHYDESGYNYRRIWHVGGVHAAIDVTTALPGIVIFNGQPKYRHVHLEVTPPQPYRGGTNNISDWRGEILLQLPPWTDAPPPTPDSRQIGQLGGPNNIGFGGRPWYLLKKTIIVDYPQ
jgi:hypothetical protein